MPGTVTRESSGAVRERAVVARLSALDRFLPVWIGAAMVVGLLLGRLVPGLDDALNRVAIRGTSLNTGNLAVPRSLLLVCRVRVK